MKISAGYGFKTFSSPNAGWNFTISPSYKNIKLHYFHSEEIQSLLGDTYYPFERAHAVSLMYEVQKSICKNFILFPSFGASYLNGVKRGMFLYKNGFIFSSFHYEKVNYQSWGITFDLLLMRKGKYFGIGIEGYANINPKHFLYGILLNISIY